jgi:hypothetical protein
MVATTSGDSPSADAPGLSPVSRSRPWLVRPLARFDRAWSGSVSRRVELEAHACDPGALNVLNDELDLFDPHLGTHARSSVQVIPDEVGEGFCSLCPGHGEAVEVGNPADRHIAGEDELTVGVSWPGLDVASTVCRNHHEPARSAKPLCPRRHISRPLFCSSVSRGSQMGAAGRAVAAWHAGRASRPVRQLGAGRTNRGSDFSTKHTSAIAAECFDCLDPGIGSVHEQTDGSFPGGSA